MPDLREWATVKKSFSLLDTGIPRCRYGKSEKIR
jgi:hypothetical protein